MWSALAFVLASLLPIVVRDGAREPTDVAAALAFVELALLWLFLLRMVAQRHWMRSVGRAPLTLPVVIAGCDAWTVDVSPSGVAVAVDTGMPAVGSMVPVALGLPDGPLTTGAEIVDRRVVGGQRILGLSLALDPAQRVRWVGQAFDRLGLEGAGGESGDPFFAVAEHRSRTRADRIARLVDLVAIASASAISVVVIGLLVLALLGYRPLVVRSASMVPTLRIGDLVLVDDVRAADLRVSDIVTFDDRGSGQVVTHRVVRIDREGDRVRFETRGDANSTSELWSRSPGATVSRLSLRVPAVGQVLGRLRDPDSRWIFLGLAIALALAAVTRAAFVPSTSSRGANAPDQQRHHPHDSSGAGRMSSRSTHV